MWARFWVVLSLLLCSGSLWAQQPQGFVVSIHPLFLIAKEITKGIEEPILLLPNQSGHDVQLTPANRKAVQDAELVMWLGKAHEAPLDKLLSQNPKAISLLNMNILATLPLRDVRGNAIANSVDTHVWLDPNNAIRIGFFIAALRSKQHPENKAQYWANAQNFAKQMLQNTQKFGRNKKAMEYWSYHDAYQYIERPLNLKIAGALSEDPHLAPTLAQIKYLNDTRPYPSMCLLAEGQAASSQYKKLQPFRFATVDESLSSETNFITAWDDLARTIQNCTLNIQK
ncbi:metal ABC transporter solute-binding protein, Zn/Mn family [Acinetobacter sp. MD2(2019)]|uniref:metal ABC transporter solute-binding protein, Zn/Mn family n=1 Tax=Acinetobacter sp. MD2(2019) TaxID=2605273 RepID=UPI002D1E99CA|nr:zinc ABC transporter substrate-binding protein [Acinetobacter sp. MD2(2019)]MEB3753169.1 zinc ABC transporter substrate-binding protein [Acinetobacter sp. MD2(2019)]